VQLQKKLMEANLLANGSQQPDVVFWTNSPSNQASIVIQQLWGDGDVQIKKME
jgi:hypothetical protein